MNTKEERELWDIIHTQAEYIGRLQGAVTWLINVAKFGSESEQEYTKAAITCGEKAMKECDFYYNAR